MFKSEVKSQGSTLELPLILSIWSMEEVSGIPSVGVKSVEIRKNIDGEGSLLGHF